jgi:hypothetical protein
MPVSRATQGETEVSAQQTWPPCRKVQEGNGAAGSNPPVLLGSVPPSATGAAAFMRRALARDPIGITGWGLLARARARVVHTAGVAVRVSDGAVPTDQGSRP